MEEQAARIEEVGRDIRRIKQYFLWTFVITVVMVVLPIIGIMILIPSVLSMYSNVAL